MFFLLPKVLVVLLATFAVLTAWRSFRQRHGRAPPAKAARRIGRRRRPD